MLVDEKAVYAAEPDASATHVDIPIAAIPAAKVKVDNPHFTAKLRDILKDQVHPDTFNAAVTIARAHAGGKVRAEKQAKLKADTEAAKAESDALDNGGVADSPEPNDPAAAPKKINARK